MCLNPVLAVFYMCFMCLDPALTVFYASFMCLDPVLAVFCVFYAFGSRLRCVLCAVVSFMCVDPVLAMVQLSVSAKETNHQRKLA